MAVRVSGSCPECLDEWPLESNSAGGSFQLRMSVIYAGKRDRHVDGDRTLTFPSWRGAHAHLTINSSSACAIPVWSNGSAPPTHRIGLEVRPLGARSLRLKRTVA